MAVADSHGLPVGLSIESASPHEVKLVASTLVEMVVAEAPESLVGDNAYDSDKLDAELRQYGIELIAPHRSNRKNKTQDGRRLRRYRRATGSKTLREFQLRPSETFLYTCGAVDLWEREIGLLDEEPGSVSVDAPLCLGGRGAAPPQPCGGPTGYRLMLKRQRMGEAMGTPVQREAAVGMWAASDPEAPPETWRSYRQILPEGFASIDRRLQAYGVLVNSI
jgi:hypothetical protein